MSAFAKKEVEHLRERKLGPLATVGRLMDGPVRTTLPGSTPGTRW